MVEQLEQLWHLIPGDFDRSDDGLMGISDYVQFNIRLYKALVPVDESRKSSSRHKLKKGKIKALAKTRKKQRKGKKKGRVKRIVFVLSPEEGRQREEAAHAVAMADWEHDTAHTSGIMTKSTFCNSMFELVRK